jgi:hypothetical protein
VLAGAFLWITEGRGTPGRRLDVPGAVLVTAGVAALAYGIAESEPHGWTSAGSALPLAAGAVLLAAFVAVEARTDQPLMPLRLFRVRSVSAGNAVLLAGGGAMFSTWYFLSLYMQNVLHYSPVRTGLAFLPHTAAVVVGSKLAPRLMGRADARLVSAAGGILAAGGLAWQSRLGVHSGYLGTLALPGALTMLGAGLMLTPVAAAATSGVGTGEQGVVSGLLNTSRQLGGALGLTILATAAADRTHTRAAGGNSAAQALTSGYSLAFVLGAASLVAAAALVALLPAPTAKPAAPPAR